MSVSTLVKSAAKVAKKAVVKAAVIVSTALSEAIAIQEIAKANAMTKKVQTALVARAESKRLKLDRKEAGQMVAASWIAAFDTEKLNPAELLQFAKEKRGDVSKCLTLAFCATPKAEAEQTKAIAHNDKLPANAPKRARIGETDMLAISRGELTFQGALDKKAEGATRKRGKGKKGSSAMDEAFTPVERLANAFQGIMKSFEIGSKDSPSADECREAFNVALDKHLNVGKPTPDAVKQVKQLAKKTAQKAK